MSRPLWFVELVKAAFPSRFLAAQSTNVPLLGDVLDRWLFGGDKLLYLPQDGVLAINQPIEVPDEIVLPSQVIEHFIEQASTHWIMNFCICRDSNQCQDYPVELGCLFLGEAAREINPALGRFVSREEALAHARRCREAGLVHLIGRNKLDTVWLGVGPGDRLLTICHCCPCCCLWRTLPHLAPQIGDKVQRMPGVRVRVTERCVGCGACTREVCFVDAIHLEGSRAVIDTACRGCGRCVAICPQGAIELTVEHNRFVQESIAQISPLVDIS
jgi:ferredoxin